MGKVEIFSYAGATFGVYEEEGKAVFMIGDVLYALNEQRTKAQLKGRIEESDYVLFDAELNGEFYSTEGINEIGLFRLILTSPNKDEAKHFYLWVTSKIIPYIAQFIRKEHPHRYDLPWGAFFLKVASIYKEYGRASAEALWDERKMPYALPTEYCLMEMGSQSFCEVKDKWEKRKEKKTEPNLKIVTSDNFNDG